MGITQSVVCAGISSIGETRSVHGEETAERPDTRRSQMWSSGMGQEGTYTSCLGAVDTFLLSSLCWLSVPSSCHYELIAQPSCDSCASHIQRFSEILQSTSAKCGPQYTEAGRIYVEKSLFSVGGATFTITYHWQHINLGNA